MQLEAERRKSVDSRATNFQVETTRRLDKGEDVLSTLSLEKVLHKG